MKTKLELAIKKREWVNREYSRQVSGTHMTNTKKTKLLRKLWREAKRNIH